MTQQQQDLTVEPVPTIGVVGAGAWGTALAAVARRAGRESILWAREPEVVESIRKSGRNAPFLPTVPLPDGIRATNDMADLAEAEAVLLVVPSQFLRGVVRDVAKHVGKSVPLIICSKGVEASTGALLAEIVAEEAPGHPIGVLSGPTFAAEVATGLPTAVTLGVNDPDAGTDLAGSLGARLAVALATPTFRPYLTDDVIGAEIGGAVKNVLAIAAGISKGRGYGTNAHAALITRGLAEMGRLSEVLGGRQETLMGLSGLGDLVLTCSSEQSRNMSFGLRLGRGETVEEILEGRRDVVEGVANAASVASLAAKHGLEMPIVAAVNALLHEGADIDETIQGLLSRPLRSESDATRDQVVLPLEESAAD